MASTATFGNASLGFIKVFEASIKCGGKYHESDLTPFLFGANPSKYKIPSPTVFASYSPTTRANSLRGRGQYCSRPLEGGLDE